MLRASTYSSLISALSRPLIGEDGDEISRAELQWGNVGHERPEVLWFFCSLSHSRSETAE